MIVSPLTISADRGALIDFTQPFLEDGVGILIKKPNNAPELFKVFRPLHIQYVQNTYAMGWGGQVWVDGANLGGMNLKTQHKIMLNFMKVILKRLR